MGREITVLDQNTIDKIAAGEVVERPASVVKELVENAIDAGATAVTAEIKDGGKTLIRITDNGSGIETDQVRKAFLRHATSKIAKVEDLERISSLGFRGEALSSIAAVSQVEVITKTLTAMSGCRYVIEGGVEKGLEEIGAPEGTTFLVRNLFFNTPARSKFLKSDTTEAGYISSLLEQLALSHPEISFKLIQNGQVKLHTSGNYNPKDVIYHIYGREITKELLDLHCENEFMSADGFIGRPALSRGNRNFENYSVNGRYVKDKIITRAIEDAYKGFLMQHKFPFVLLQIQMKGNDLDVNVHPAKMEVRFARGPEVYDTLFQGIVRTLKQQELIPEVELEKPEKKIPRKELVPRKEIPEPFETRSRQNLVLRETRKDYAAEKEAAPLTAMAADKETAVLPSAEKEAASPPARENRAPAPRTQEPAFAAEPSLAAPEQMELPIAPMLSRESRAGHRLIGQLFETYWLVEYRDHFYMIDQHAAHEKVLYERLIKAFREQRVTSQYVSPPIVVSLSLAEVETLEQNRDLFADFGFEIRSFGGREYTIDAVPSNLYGMTEEGAFTELLDQMGDSRRHPDQDLFAGRLATMACKAAVKGNQALSAAEADQLINELLLLDNPYHCPHGRPTIISMSRTELEKKFKRIVS